MSTDCVGIQFGDSLYYIQYCYQCKRDTEWFQGGCTTCVSNSLDSIQDNRFYDDLIKELDEEDKAAKRAFDQRKKQ